jgi:hypothetical protein
LLSCDASGVTHYSVLASNFLGVTAATSQCLLDGSAGRLLDVAVLDGWCCLVSRRSCFVVGLSDVKVLAKWPLDFSIRDPSPAPKPPDPDRPETDALPHLAWARVPVPGGGGETRPLLCRGHAGTLSILAAEAMADEAGEAAPPPPAFGVTTTYEVKSPTPGDPEIAAVAYVSPSLLAASLRSPHLLLYSSLTHSLLLTVSLPSPSPLLRPLPSAPGLLLLSPSPSSNSLSLLSPTSPPAAADSLVAAGKWRAALSLVCRLYRAGPLVVSRGGERRAIKRQVSDILSEHRYFRGGKDPELGYIEDYITKYERGSERGERERARRASERAKRSAPD